MADNDVVARLNNEAAQRLSESGAKPLTGGGSAVSVVAGINPTDTQLGGGHFQDQQGVHGATVHGLGSLFTSKKGDGPVAKALKGMQGDLSKMSADMHEQIRQASAGLVGASGGSGAGGIEGPMPTPAPVAANDRSGSTSRSA